jgi:chaperone required for assembly of F1-ATPase
MRPLVVDANAKVTLHTTSRAQSYRISIDGRSFNMPCETIITISKSPHAALIARRKNLNFAATLRKKLLWGAK